MKPLNFKILYRRTALVIYDIISTAASSFLALFIRYEFSFSVIPRQFRNPIERFLPFNIVITLLLFYIFRLYSSLWAYAGETELQSIVISCALSGVVNLIGLQFFLSLHDALPILFSVCFCTHSIYVREQVLVPLPKESQAQKEQP